jgi:periplasmic divalent cation tolerance protein
MTNNPAKYGVLLTTTATKDDAKKIAEMLLAEKLAACVQIMPIESYYTWKGAVAQDPEFLLLVKTKTLHFERAIEAIKKNHSYDTPEIVGTEFIAGSAPYFRWIDEVTE